MIDLLDTVFDKLQEIEGSSHIALVATKDHWLIVQFKNRSIYRYPDAAFFFDDLVTTESAGRFFSQNIRCLECEKIHETDSWDDLGG